MNANEVDFTKPFRFTSAGDEYTYNPPINGANKKCTITWEDESGAGAEVYTLNSVKSYIEEGDWCYVKDSAHKHEQQCPNAYANEALKAFTEATRASVSVINGTYTILYNEACYEAEDDEKLNEIIKCITFLENC